MYCNVVRNLTLYISIRCRSSDWLQSRLKSKLKLKTLKMVPTSVMSCAIVNIGEMPRPKTDVIFYLAQLGLSGNSRAIKELDVCRTFYLKVMHIRSRNTKSTPS